VAQLAGHIGWEMRIWKRNKETRIPKLKNWGA
jgi:predicted acetyltransferase